MEFHSVLSSVFLAQGGCPSLMQSLTCHQLVILLCWSPHSPRLVAAHPQHVPSSWRDFAALPSIQMWEIRVFSFYRINWIWTCRLLLSEDCHERRKRHVYMRVEQMAPSNLKYLWIQQKHCKENYKMLSWHDRIQRDCLSLGYYNTSLHFCSVRVCLFLHPYLWKFCTCKTIYRWRKYIFWN